MEPALILLLVPEYNARGKRDFVSAYRPEAEAFARLHHTPQPILFDNTRVRPERLRRVRHEIECIGPNALDGLAIFGDGGKHELQIGAHVGRVTLLADSIRRVVPRNAVITIALYCGHGGVSRTEPLAPDPPGPGSDGGFAEALRNELRWHDTAATIFAPDKHGHCTFNPYVRRYDHGETAGGHWIVAPGSELWSRWQRALKSTDLRFRYPFMGEFEVFHELRQRGSHP